MINGSEQNLNFQSHIHSNKKGWILILKASDAELHLHKTLQKAGFRVTELDEPEEALAVCEQGPDLVLLGTRLVGSSVFDICERIKSDALFGAIPVIMLATEEQKKEVHSRASECGADAVIPSDADTDILISSIYPWIRSHKLDVERLKLLEESELQKEELRQNQERLKLALDAAEMGTWRNLDNGLVIRDAALNRMLGLEPKDSELPGSDFMKRVHPDDRTGIIENLDRTVRTGLPYRNEFRIFRPDGEMRWLRSQGRVIHGENGHAEFVTGAIIDITERKRAEDQLKKIIIEQNAAREALEEAVAELHAEKELRERFVATLTHDLRTPLTSAKMNAQFIETKSEDSGAKKYTQRIIHHLDRADQMILDLLDANRIRAGEKIPMVKEYCELNRLISEIVDDMNALYPNRFQLKKNEPLHGYWSCNGIRRIVENLCTNAIKYGSPDDPVQISSELEEDLVVIEVHNEGPAIAPDDLKRLFEPFKRTHSAQQGKQKGWGLGLTLVKGLAEAHGGNVTVESSLDRGTTFRIIFPVNNELRN